MSNTAKWNIEDAVKVGSKLTLNTQKLKEKIQKQELEILFGLTHHWTKQYHTNVAKIFFNWSTNIFQSAIDYKKFSIETQWRLFTGICKIYTEYSNDIIARLYPHHVTNWHYVTVELKKNVLWILNVKLWKLFMTVVSLNQSR